MNFRLFLILILLFVVNSCKSAKTQYKEQMLKNTVSKYNTILPEVYRVGDVSLLDDVAAEGEKRRIEVNIINMKNEGKYLNAKLLELQFNSVKFISPTEAKIVTGERWKYNHINIFTGTQVDDTREEYMNMVYSLIREQDKWLVDYVDVEGKPLGKKVDRFREYKKFVEEYERQKEKKMQQK